MTEQQYQAAAASIALTIWEISTGNGLHLPRDEWDSHMTNCDAAVANTYVDGITVKAWQTAALARLA